MSCSLLFGQCATTFLHNLLTRFRDLLNDEEGTTREAFVTTCLHDPSLRNHFPVLVQSFVDRRKASMTNTFLRDAHIQAFLIGRR